MCLQNKDLKVMSFELERTLSKSMLDVLTGKLEEIYVRTEAETYMLQNKLRNYSGCLLPPALCKVHGT